MGSPEREEGRFGLCSACDHQQVVRSGRGSVFSLCRRSKTEPRRFPKYPRVPVIRCVGFEKRSFD